jgi:hypothetical protein
LLTYHREKIAAPFYAQNFAMGDIPDSNSVQGYTLTLEQVTGNLGYITSALMK